jgi:tetratricopeptide (TPR) repeat protein
VVAKHLTQHFIAVVLAASPVSTPGLVLAADQNDWPDCIQEADRDASIPASTRIVDDDNDTANDRAIAYYNRGNAYYFKGDYDRAIADYGEAVWLNPGFSYAYANRSKLYELKGDYGHAIADIRIAIELNPKKFSYSDRGDLYAAKGNYNRAISDYNTALEDPALNVLAVAVTYLNRCKAYQATGIPTAR